MPNLIRSSLPVLLLSVLPCFAGVTVDHLRCEYRENPLGIDDAAPRLSWQLTSTERGQRQTAYHVRVAASRMALLRGEADLWNSGRVQSTDSFHVRYTGRALTAGQIAFWSVQVWDREGQPSAWSAPATWELGLPTAADWGKARWILLAQDSRSSPLSKRPYQTRNTEEPKIVESYVSPLLRREFEVKPGVQRARAYICGLGYHELYLNGRKSGDAVLEPGQTSYDVHAYYVTHDLTTLLQPGPNAVGVMLGNGFYGQNIAFGGRLGYGQPGLLARIVIDYIDGTRQVIVTDDSWRATTGPVLFDNVYNGETYDARREHPGWHTAGHADADWPAAKIADAPLTTVLKAQMIPPIRALDRVPAVALWTDTQGRTVFDLGINIAGWVHLKVRAPAGTEITLRMAEVLMPDKKDIDPAGTGGFVTGSDQIEKYVCRGGGEEEWHPRFTYHGFRYVEVTGLPEPKRENIIGVVVRTDLPRAGSFASSDDYLNRVYRTSLRTIEGNIHSMLEDCPHREKCAWLGDTHAVGETMIFNYETALFLTKFMADVETICGPARGTYQGKPGTPGIPSNVGLGRRLPQEARPDWGDAVVLVPWYLYLYYGDTRVMADHYPLIKRWLAHVGRMAKADIIYQGYGDWCPPGSRDDPVSNPVEITSTAFHYGSLRRAAAMARVLGHTADAQDFDARADRFRRAFNATFLDRATMSFGSQTSNAVALRFGLPSEADAPRVAAALARRIQTTDRGHHTTGIHGARPLYTVLDDHGHSDVAMDVMTVPDYPGYRYLLDWGFTTWPERYVDFQPSERFPDRSYNHPMQSGFAAWFHESVAGIRPDPAAPGFRHIEMKPQQFRRIEWVKASHAAPTGPIRSEWTSRAGRFEWAVSVPPGSTATVYVPTADATKVRESEGPAGTAPGVRFLRYADGRAIYEILSGEYRFTSQL